MAGAAGYGAVPQRLPGRLGTIPRARRGRGALSVTVARRGKGRPARRGLPSKQPGATLDRFARADIVIARTKPRAARERGRSARYAAAAFARSSSLGGRWAPGSAAIARRK